MTSVHTITEETLLGKSVQQQSAHTACAETDSFVDVKTHVMKELNSNCAQKTLKIKTTANASSGHERARATQFSHYFEQARRSGTVLRIFATFILVSKPARSSDRSTSATEQHRTTRGFVRTAITKTISNLSTLL